MRVSVVRLRNAGKRLAYEDTRLSSGVDGYLFFKEAEASLHGIEDRDSEWIFPGLREATVSRIQNAMLLIDGIETVLVPDVEAGSLAKVTQYRQTWRCRVLGKT
jgi:hypothetical protein